jgi:hypothetical protein
MNTTEGNKLIAEFMGFGNVSKDEFIYAVILSGKAMGYKTPKDMLFHTSWDWLMPVVEQVDFDSAHFVEIQGRSCTIKNANLEWVHCSQGVSRIDATYKAVINFIKWHNEQQ